MSGKLHNHLEYPITFLAHCNNQMFTVEGESFTLQANETRDIEVGARGACVAACAAAV